LLKRIHILEIRTRNRKKIFNISISIAALFANASSNSSSKSGKARIHGASSSPAALISTNIISAYIGILYRMNELQIAMISDVFYSEDANVHLINRLCEAKKNGAQL